MRWLLVGLAVVMSSAGIIIVGGIFAGIIAILFLAAFGAFH